MNISAAKPKQQKQNRLALTQRAERASNESNSINNKLSQVTHNNSDFRRGTKSCIIEEDEFIGEIPGSVGFSTVQYAINPGQSGTFPWLSKQAAQWEKYRFEMLHFYYKTELNQFSTQAVGKVMLNVDFDASDAPPGTKQQVLDTDPHNDAAPYQAFNLKLRPEDLDGGVKTKWVRPGILPGAVDIKTYDAGNLFVSTQGQANTSNIGELHVRYRVRFETPVLESATSAPQNNQVTLLTDAAPIAAAATAVAKVDPLANVQTNGLQITNSSGSLTLQPGNYVIDYNAQLANTTANGVSWSMQLAQNGVSVGPAVLSYGSNSIPASMSLSQYVSIPATTGNAITFTQTATYAGGSPTFQGTVRVTSV